MNKNLVNQGVSNTTNPFPDERTKFSLTITPYNCSDERWINGVAQSWATAFVIPNSNDTQNAISVNTCIKLIDGSIRKVVETRINKDDFIVFLDGDPLDGSVVGYPNVIEVISTDESKSQQQEQHTQFSTPVSLIEREYSDISPYSSITVTPENCSDDCWLNGVARSWGTAFFISGAKTNQESFSAGKNVRFIDNSVRRIIGTKLNNDDLIVFLEGPPLDGTVVGFPNKIEITPSNEYYEQALSFYLDALMQAQSRFNNTEALQTCYDYLGVSSILSSTVVPDNCTDERWLNGVARSWATAFFVLDANSLLNTIFTGMRVLFIDGTIRKIVETKINNDDLIVFLDGDPLDGTAVGYPNKIEIFSYKFNQMDSNKGGI